MTRTVSPTTRPPGPGRPARGTARVRRTDLSLRASRSESPGDRVTPGPGYDQSCRDRFLVDNSCHDSSHESDPSVLMIYKLASGPGRCADAGLQALQT
eukprot:757394-Hanusia_phi.AAC.4